MPDRRRNFYYLRLSQEDAEPAGPDAESGSISAQRLCIHGYIREHFPPEESFEEVVDDGWSGTDMNRPGIRRLLRLADAGEVGVIIVRDLSRFARSYLEAGRYIEVVFPQKGVRFISVNEGFDSFAAEESGGGLELAVRNLMNQLYSRDLSAKIRSTLDMKKKNGEYVFGSVPYGYRKGERRNTIRPDPEAADIVRTVFRWAAEGVRISEIARRLNTLAVPTPSAHLAPVRGHYRVAAFWSFDSVRCILDNRIYTGDLPAFRSRVERVGGKRVRPLPQAEQFILPGTHEAIISRELFEMTRRDVLPRKPPLPEAGGPFVSLLVCGCCGKHLVKGKRENKNWSCPSARYQDRLNCAEVRIGEDKLAAVLTQELSAQLQLTDQAVRKRLAAERVLRDKQTVLRAELDVCRKRLERLQAEVMREYERYTVGRLSRPEFVRRKERISTEREQLRLRAGLLQQRLDGAAVSPSEGPETGAFRVIAGQAESNPALTRELLRTLIRQITVFPEGRLRIEWRFRDPFVRTESGQEPGKAAPTDSPEALPTETGAGTAADRGPGTQGKIPG